MAKRIRIDSNKLIEMVQKGTVQKEILEKFGFNNASQLKVAYANALMQSGKAPTIQTDPSAKRTAKANRVVNVSKRGSIAIPRKLIEELGLKIGETFAVRPSKAGLSLRKIVQSRDIVDNPDGS